jgi:hypothetical protein
MNAFALEPLAQNVPIRACNTREASCVLLFAMRHNMQHRNGIEDPDTPPAARFAWFRRGNLPTGIRTSL